MEVLHYNLDMTPESEWKIVSAGAFARDKLLYLQEAGHFISGANYYTVRKELDSYLVKLTLSGAGILEYGGETYRLPAGSFFWIDCRAPQHYYTAPDTGQWDVLWFHFYGATADAYYQAFLSQTQGRAAASLPVDSPVSAQMSALLALAGEDGGGLGRDLDASALMTTILCGLIHGAAQQRPQPVPAVLQKVRQYLHEQYAQKITLDTLSARYNISKYHLQRSFQRYFGQSPGEYLTRLRLTRAKRDRPAGIRSRLPCWHGEHQLFYQCLPFPRRRYASAVPPPLVAGGISAASSSAVNGRYSPGRSASSSRTGPIARRFK